MLVANLNGLSYCDRPLRGYISSSLILMSFTRRKSKRDLICKHCRDMRSKHEESSYAKNIYKISLKDRAKVLQGGHWTGWTSRQQKYLKHNYQNITHCWRGFLERGKSVGGIWCELIVAIQEDIPNQQWQKEMWSSSIGTMHRTLRISPLPSWNSTRDHFPNLFLSS